ncbi:hypothetical protein ACWD04_29920 [Streptomyces sp. NPDC002911]
MAWKRPGQVGQGGGFAVGDDLLDDGVVAVFLFGLQGCDRLVGEEEVVAPDGKQLALLTGNRRFGEVLDAAHDQSGGDSLRFLSAREGGVLGYLGDFGVRDEFAGFGAGQRSRVGDLLPGVVGNAVNGSF